MPIQASMTQMPGDNGTDVPNSSGASALDTEAQLLIRTFLPDSIPADVRNKPFYEIAKYKDEKGNNIGVSAIGDAWDAARNYLMSQSPLGDRGLSKVLLDIASLSSGSGLFGNQIQNVMVGFDKYNKALTMPNIEFSGLTFFTRPRLCLQSSNLRSNPNMVPLDTTNPSSIAFAIRYLLDTNLLNATSKNHDKLCAAAEQCPLINKESPWFIPLSNALTSLGGLPSYELVAETTPGGYFQEAQAYAVGANNFSDAGMQVNCTFKELPGSIIFAIFYYWLEYMRCVTRGDMLAYPDDIDGQIMNYTISIYCFNMDPSMRYITRWAKCTGCFPTSLNIGDSFTKSTNDPIVKAAQSVTVNFKCNRVEYMKPECLLDFNTLATRYCPDISLSNENDTISTDNVSAKPLVDLRRPGIPDSPFANFCGLPFIVSDPNGYRLLYRKSNHDLFGDPIVRKLIAYDIATSEKEWENGPLGNNYSLYQKYDYNDFYNLDVQHAKDIAGVFSFDEMVEAIKNGKFASL